MSKHNMEKNKIKENIFWRWKIGTIKMFTKLISQTKLWIKSYKINKVKRSWNLGKDCLVYIWDNFWRCCHWINPKSVQMKLWQHFFLFFNNLSISNKFVDYKKNFEIDFHNIYLSLWEWNKQVGKSMITNTSLLWSETVQ